MSNTKVPKKKDVIGNPDSKKASANVLLVEDNPADAVLIREYFKENSLNDSKVQWVDRLSAAFKFLHEQKVEAILLDLGLPDSKGFSTFDQIYRVCPHIPIIILTGFEDGDLATKAVRAGAQDFLVKGLVTSESLLKSINYAIERKRALEAEQESQRKLSTLMSNLPGMAYRCLNDQNWTMQFVSEGSKNLTGYLPEDMINNKTVTYDSLIHADDKQRIWKEVQSALKSGNFFRFVYRIYTKLNQLKWVWEQGSGVYDEKGQLIALEGFITDISEQIEYQKKLRKFSAAVNHAVNMICITSTKGNVEYVNPAYVKGTGHSYKEVHGQPLQSIKVVADNENYFQQVFETIASGQIWNDKVQCRKKSGDLYWEQLNASPIFDDNGQVTHAIFVGTDITGELKTQQQLIDADKMSAIGLLAAGVAHEFKNFLGGIIGYATYAQSSIDSDKAPEIIKDTLAQIVEIGEKANEVAMSLLTYSRVKSNVMTQHDLKHVISKTIDLFSKEIKTHQIQLKTELKDTPKIKMSPGRIQQVLLNLLINARDAIEKHGNILVSLENDEDTARLKVSDNGVGIEQKNLSKIFDPFYSTKGVWGKDQVVGTGMGLSVSRNIAREHGGDLTVESRTGHGTTFTLTLPISDEIEDSVFGVDSTEVHTEITDMIVISLNNSVIAKYNKEVQQSRRKLHVVNALGDLQKLLNQNIDLILVDAQFSAKVELHNMIEACKKASVPIVMINCGALEYQLNDLYETSAAVYRDCPDLKQIVMQYQSLLVLQNQKIN